MTKTDWQNIRSIIDTVLELDEALRENALRKVIENHPEYGEALQSHYRSITESSDFWDESFTLSQQLINEQIDTKAFSSIPFVEYKTGSRIGVYLLEEKIAEGGMGMVFKARRDDGHFDRTVAIKLMALNMQFEEMRTRFKREQQILASLNHPNIAKLYDAGLTVAGNPYLVMEFIEGEELLDYFQHRQLSIGERLTLFLKICAAVEYAHQNLIVHRDLKPANILVSAAGKLTVLDFGIAKLMDQTMDPLDVVITQEQQRIYSLSYASPEQVTHAPISTLSDIYTLGLLLYELVTHQKPFDLDNLTRARAEQIVLNDEILSIRRRSSFPESRDLDAIISKAVRKEPKDRYHSVSELATDIKNFLTNKPVDATRGNNLYKAHKFWKRHRTNITISIVILMGVILSTVFYTIQINEERRIAQRESERAQYVSNYLLGLFENADPFSEGGKNQTITEFIKQSIDDLSGLDGQPELKKEAAYTLGLVNMKLGGYNQAQHLFSQSLALQRKLFDEPQEEARMLIQLGEVKIAESHFRDAITYFDSASTHLDLVSNQDSDLVFSLKSNQAVAFAHIDSLEKAEALIQPLINKTNENKKHESVILLQRLADISREKKNFDQSLTLEQQALALLEQENNEDKEALLSAYNNIGYSYRQLNDNLNAVLYYRMAMNLGEELLGERHPNVITGMQNLSFALLDLGEFDETCSIQLEILHRMIGVYGENHWRTGSAYGSYARILSEIDRDEESKEAYEKSVTIYANSLGSSHFWTLRQQIRLVIALLQQGEIIRANNLLDTTLAQLTTTITKPLAYYDKSGLEAIIAELDATEFPSEHQKLVAFMSWYTSAFE